MIIQTHLHLNHNNSAFSDMIQQKLYYYLYFRNSGSSKIYVEGAAVTVEASYALLWRCRVILPHIKSTSENGSQLRQGLQSFPWHVELCPSSGSDHQSSHYYSEYVIMVYMCELSLGHAIFSIGIVTVEGYIYHYRDSLDFLKWGCVIHSRCLTYSRWRSACSQFGGAAGKEVKRCTAVEWV